MTLFTIHSIADLPGFALARFIAESEAEGWHFVRRLVDEWEDGANRFDKPGERLFVARSGDVPIGICGLNADPYLRDGLVGRVRRLFVLAEFRGQGVGRRLVQAVIKQASGHFTSLHVRTANPVASHLYERLGFQPADGLSCCTHLLTMTSADSPHGDARRGGIMTTDEEQIRQLVSTWHAAIKAGDVDTVLALMTDDVVFLLPGRPPMDKSAFAAAARVPPGTPEPRIDGSSEILEIQLAGEWAFLRTHISVSMVPPGAAQPIHREGHTLSVLRKTDDRWLLARDANLLAPLTPADE